MRVEYINNNGYIVETEKAIYVFDFVDGILPGAYFRKDKPLIFFVSNKDDAYYSQSIYSYKKTVIISFDIPADPYSKVFKMFPGEMLHLGFAKVFAISSTLEGVSYVIEEDDTKIFYAGSFNFWHYQDFASEKRVQFEKDIFMNALDEVEKHAPFDVAVFPVNPDVGINYDHGAKTFITKLKPKHFFPTQFKRNGLIENFSSWAMLENDTTYHGPKYSNHVFELDHD